MCGDLSDSKYSHTTYGNRSSRIMPEEVAAIRAHRDTELPAHILNRTAKYLKTEIVAIPGIDKRTVIGTQ